MEAQKFVGHVFLDAYRLWVQEHFPGHLNRWPFLNSFGYEVDIGIVGTVTVLIFKRDNTAAQFRNGIGDLSHIVNVDDINEENREFVREKILRDFDVPARGAVVFLGQNLSIEHELRVTMDRHAMAIGVAPMKIFLSHKGANKELVRSYNSLLKELGFDTWLDEEQVHAGLNIHRAIDDGLKESCAAIFFVTKDFKDEKYLESEIDLAIERYTMEKDRFRIITLLLDSEASLPPLLKRFAYKQPKNDLEAVKEIIRALPIKLGEVRRRYL